MTATTKVATTTTTTTTEGRGGMARVWASFSQRRPPRGPGGDGGEPVGGGSLLKEDAAVAEDPHRGLPRSHSKAKPLQWSFWNLLPRRPSVARALLSVLLFSLLLSAFLLLSLSAFVLARANRFGRRCLNSSHSQLALSNWSFAIVSCSDGAAGGVPGRSFEGLLGLVASNKQKYAKRHGYTYIDGSDLIDTRRPPSWSKIIAVRRHLPNYDWVFWNDADSIVMNLTIALEDIIGSIVRIYEYDNMPDFIVTEDVTGVNAGMFIFRNSSWSMGFLDLWWNQSSFIKPFGHSKSGDNDALKDLIKNMPEEERRRHVLIPQMQCVFNSYLWRPSLKSALRLMTMTRSVWQGAYSKGDFMVHLAGLDDKKKWMKEILKDIEEANPP